MNTKGKLFVSICALWISVAVGIACAPCENVGAMSELAWKECQNCQSGVAKSPAPSCRNEQTDNHPIWCECSSCKKNCRDGSVGAMNVTVTQYNTTTCSSGVCPVYGMGSQGILSRIDKIADTCL